MQKSEILKILKEYGIDTVEDYKEIDSTKGNDYRLNLILDKKYVLRMNNAVLDEERLQSIARLCERYRKIGVLAPKLYQNSKGQYITNFGEHICYLSDYLDYATADELQSEQEIRVVQDEVLRSVGVLAANFTDVDLSPVNSMWSLIDLAPLDIDIDEKQENVNLFVEALEQMNEVELADRVNLFNETKREKIKSVYKNLPCCMIQGDLNLSNLLISDGHFVGLIDFNMAGTEVNVNAFCCETNGEITEEEFNLKTAKEVYADWIGEQNRELAIILKEYELNETERDILEDYCSVGLISQYSNVMAYLQFLKEDKAKAIEIIELILAR